MTECIEENILADFLRKNRTEAIEVCIFEYDEKRVFGIYRLYRDKYTENQIAEQMKIDVEEVRNILEKFKE